ncbi:MAG TPA: bifunctional adenosylcobinamide kinase/adenosylcobinamide-phosphate guanylyltransferase [Mycobacteriales bacterium]|nr:bifunctional adenosylcobinamide kinase/adenosylcobinamide-phosphate guanylyltransferase [Mycobacteriales bacterium]
MLILLLGGASSGKSAVAESIVARLPAPVTYVATLRPDPRDPDLMQRIDAHRDRRPAEWATVDATADLPQQIASLDGTVLLDSLGPWVALHRPDPTTTRSLAQALSQRRGHTVVVSDEVGLSVHPASQAGRVFQDAIGEVNQLLAEAADETLLVVAGRLLRTSPVDVDAVLRGRV